MKTLALGLIDINNDVEFWNSQITDRQKLMLTAPSMITEIEREKERKRERERERERDR